jgi:hypothetical protein
VDLLEEVRAMQCPFARIRSLGAAVSARKKTMNVVALRL